MSDEDPNKQIEKVFDFENDFAGFLLVELAPAYGVRAWHDKDSRTKVHLAGPLCKVKCLLQSADPAIKLLLLVQFNVLLGAVLTAGGKPSEKLLSNIEEMPGLFGLRPKLKPRQDRFNCNN